MLSACSRQAVLVAGGAGLCAGLVCEGQDSEQGLAWAAAVAAQGRIRSAAGTELCSILPPCCSINPAFPPPALGGAVVHGARSLVRQPWSWAVRMRSSWCLQSP